VGPTLGAKFATALTSDGQLRRESAISGILKNLDLLPILLTKLGARHEWACHSYARSISTTEIHNFTGNRESQRPRQPRQLSHEIGRGAVRNMNGKIRGDERGWNYFTQATKQ